jgi:hypothetical protein
MCYIVIKWVIHYIIKPQNATKFYYIGFELNRKQFERDNKFARKSRVNVDAI